MSLRSESLNPTLVLVIFLLATNSRSRMELQVNVGRVVGGTSRRVAWWYKSLCSVVIQVVVWLRGDPSRCVVV